LKVVTTKDGREPIKYSGWCNLQGGFNMSNDVPGCKISVIKRTIHQDLIDEYLDVTSEDYGRCECFKDGQEFVIEKLDELSRVPEGFCAWAWADIRKDILCVATGGDLPGFKKKGTALAGCSDWFRPVIFKIERLE